MLIGGDAGMGHFFYKASSPPASQMIRCAPCLLPPLSFIPLAEMNLSMRQI